MAERFNRIHNLSNRTDIFPRKSWKWWTYMLGVVILGGILLNMLSRSVAFFAYDQQFARKHDSFDPTDTYTIVVSTYSRDMKLTKHLHHWLSCPNVFQVQVLWHNPDRDPPQVLVDLVKEYTRKRGSSHHKRLLIRRQETNQLTNRFGVPSGGFMTEAVSNVDDDQAIDCGLMSAAFEQWRRLGPDSMVGFEARRIDTWQKMYKWNGACIGECVYNVMWPTKGAFLHRNYYDEYNTPTFNKLRKMVDKFITGEDMLMIYVHFSTYFLKNHVMPPILCVQPGPSYHNVIYESAENKFPLAQKLNFFVDYARKQITRTDSLHHLTADKRGDVMEAIQKLAEQRTPDMIIPPMTHSWYLVNQDRVTGKVVKNPCKDGYTTRCSTSMGFWPLAHWVIRKELIVLSFVSFVFVALVCTRKQITPGAIFSKYS